MQVAFANLDFVIDFKTVEEAEAYKAKNSSKGWWFGPITPISDKVKEEEEVNKKAYEEAKEKAIKAAPEGTDPATLKIKAPVVVLHKYSMEIKRKWMDYNPFF